jgi:hypothetical protein
MFIFKKHLGRRTFLRGMGATVALPLLDAMIPARALRALTRPVPRLAFVYFPHGAVMDQWTPSTVGRDFQIGRILEPLSPFRERLTIVSGLENRHAYGPVHTITPGTWLSGSSPRAHGDVMPDGTTADQLAADHLGRDTQLRLMTVATEEPHKIGAGIWQGEYDESYSTTISFRSRGVPVAMEFAPRAVFDVLFRCGDSPSASVLDRVADDMASVRSRLGAADRVRLGEYLESIRDVECRIETAGTFTDRMTLMFDLIALGFRADVTRVASMMMAAEASSLTHEHLGISDSFHLLSHHQNDPEKIEKLIAIQTFHTRMFANFVGTLADLPDGDGSILDHSQILFGSNMSDSHAHDHFPLPLAVIGTGCGTLRGGQHLRYPDRTPMSNLLLTMLQRAGVPVRSVGDSTGECEEL